MCGPHEPEGSDYLDGEQFSDSLKNQRKAEEAKEKAT